MNTRQNPNKTEEGRDNGHRNEGLAETLSNMDVEDLKETLGKSVGKISEAAARTQSQIEELVKNHPVTTLACAFAVGALAGAGTVQILNKTAKGTAH